MSGAAGEMRLVVTGSTRVRDYPFVAARVREYLLDIERTTGRGALMGITLLTSGQAGVERVASVWAYEHGVPHERMTVEWVRYGRGARYMMQEMLFRTATHALVIWDGRTAVSRHALTMARRYGLYTRAVRVVFGPGGRVARWRAVDEQGPEKGRTVVEGEEVGV